MRHLLALSTLAIATSSVAAVPATYQTAADATITTTVAAPNPGGWTATTERLPVENLMRGCEYEGFNFRTRQYANADGADVIPLSPQDATGWDTRREGYFDGAAARIYRIVGGKLENVRNDTVTRHRASGWGTTLGEKLVPPGRTSFQWSFENYNSPVAPYYFSVVAVGKDGTWSKPSNAIEVARPEKCEAKAKNEGLKAFAWPRSGAGSVAGTVPPTPAAFTASTAPDGVTTFTWDAVGEPDLSGYLVLISDYPPDKHLGYGYDLAGKAATPAQQIKKDDMVFLDTGASKGIFGNVSLLTDVASAPLVIFHGISGSALPVTANQAGRFEDFGKIMVDGNARANVISMSEQKSRGFSFRYENDEDTFYGTSHTGGVHQFIPYKGMYALVRNSPRIRPTSHSSLITVPKGELNSPPASLSRSTLPRSSKTCLAAHPSRVP
jgi:hypothetical protein